MLLGTLSQLNLVNIYTRFLPTSGSRARRFILVGYFACFTIGLITATVIFLLRVTSHFLAPGALEALLFIGVVGLYTIFALQDSVLTGLRAAVWVPLENTIFGMVKLLLLLFLLHRDSPAIFLAWALPLLPVILIVNTCIFRRSVPIHEARSPGHSELPGWKTLRKFVAAEYVSGLLGAIANFLPPIVVISYLGARAEAYFYAPWMVSGFMGLLLWNLGTSWIVEARYKRGDVRHLLTRVRNLALFIIVPLLIVIMIGASFFLHFLGVRYSVEGTTLLRLLALAVVPGAVLSLYQTFLWHDGRLWQLIGTQILSIGIFLGVAFGLLDSLGINAVGVGMLAGVGLTAMLVLPQTISRWRQLLATEVP
jgi:O-antigen/teichoic acid export membrane protein